MLKIGPTLDDYKHLMWKTMGAKFNYLATKVKDVPDELQNIRNFQTGERIDELDPDDEITLFGIDPY